MTILHALLALVATTAAPVPAGALPTRLLAPAAEASAASPAGETFGPMSVPPEAVTAPTVAPAPAPAVPAAPVAPPPAPAAAAAPLPAVPAAAAPEPARRGLVARSPDELYDGGIKITLGSKGRNSIRIINWHQVWNRYMHTNPGTEVQGRPREHQYDIALRRSRLLVIGQLTPRFQIITHVGINNQTFNNARKPQLFVHEATGQVQVWKDYLHVGAGLHYWNGVSRMTNASTLNFLSLDAPIVNWPTIEQTDQFARHLGVYAKGKLGPLDYRVAFNQPFAPGTGVDEDPTGPAAVYNPQANSKQVEGYVQWQFLEPESNAVPYTVGTYLGNKKVFNVGAGFSFQPDGTWSLSPAGRIREHDIVLAAADVFVDLPLRRERGALTAYGVYYYYDFGPDHLRSVGIMNTGTGGTTLNGPGNAYPTIGTGHHAYAQAGYMLPPRWTGLQRVQPYAAAQVSVFDALDAPMVVPEAGINWLLLAHHFKLTLMVRERPVFTADEVTGRSRETTRRSEIVLQSMIYF